MQAIAVSAVQHSCERVLELFVSSYENHFDFKRASTNEETNNEEFEIAVNAPNLAHCDYSRTSIQRHSIQRQIRYYVSFFPARFFSFIIFVKKTSTQRRSVQRLFATTSLFNGRGVVFYF